MIRLMTKARWAELLCAGAFLAACGWAGASLTGAALFAVLAVLGIWLPGRALARVLGAEQAGLPATAGTVFGLGLWAVVTALASATGLHALVWVLPVAGIASLFAVRGTIPAPDNARALVRAAFWLACIAVCVLPNAHAVAAGAVEPNHDFFWNLGNAQSFLQGLPPQDLRFSGYTITYHWLSELLAAGFAMGGVPLWDALAFYLPVFCLWLLAAVLAECGALWFESRKKTAVFFVLTFLCGGAGLWKIFSYGRCPFWNLSVYHLISNVNGMGLTTLLLAGFAAGVWALWNAPKPWLWAFTGAAFVLLCFAKGPVAGVAALAFALAALVRLVFARTKQNGAVLAFAALLLAGFAVLFRVFFSAGASSKIGFSLFGTLEKSYFTNFVALLRAKSPLLAAVCAPLFMLAQTVCFAPASTPLFLTGAVGDVPRLPKLGGPRLFFTACAAGGFAAFFLFDHESMSQMYFAFIGLFFANVLAVQNLDGFLAFCARRKKALAAVCKGCAACLVLVGLAGGVFTGVQMVGDGLTTPTGDAALAGEKDLVLTAAEEEALAWAGEHLPEGILLATNRSHTGVAKEGLSNVYSGISGRPFYMESFKYAVSNLGVDKAEVDRRVSEMKTLFGPDETADGAAALCREIGVGAVIYCKTAAEKGWDITEQTQPSLFAQSAVDGFETVYENDDVTIFVLQ